MRIVHGFLYLFMLCGSALANESAVRRLLADFQTMNSFYSINLSAEDAKAYGKWLDRRLATHEKQDFSSLKRSNQIDYILIRNELELNRKLLDRDRDHLASDLQFLPFAKTIFQLDKDRRNANALNDPEAAKQVAAIVEQVKDARKYAEKKNGTEVDKDKDEEKETDDAKTKSEFNLSKAEALRVANRVRSAKGKLEKWYKHYVNYRPQFDWWMKKPYEAANKSLGEYEKFLREKIAGTKEDDGPLIGEPVGMEFLEELIAHEFVPYTAEELIAIGEREFSWCVEEAKKAAKEMGFKDRLKALEEIKNIYVNPGTQDELVARYAKEAIDFVEERELVTVPYLCKQHYDVDMIDPKVQQKIPYAMYSGNRVVVAYAAGSMEHDKKQMAMRGNNLHATRIVTAHEVVPGHHLQRFMANRYRSDRNMFGTPFYIEGWALYWEIRLWDLGFARGPEDKLGMLFWRMHRCARIIVSLKYHLGQMTPEEMVDFLVNEVGHEKAQARSEVRRYIATTTPALYQAGYMLGGLQFLNMHNQLVPKTMSEREFHDRILKLGSIPVELIRASLDETIPLSADYKASWRFYDKQ